MSLPRLRADLTDPHAAARVLRRALRHEADVVTLWSPPTTAGKHLLDLEVPGIGSVALLANVVRAVDQGYLLELRPATHAQMSELLAIVEQIVEPSFSTRPPSEFDPLWGIVEELAPADNFTVSSQPNPTDVSAVVTTKRAPVLSEMPRGFGVIDSPIPPGMSIGPDAVTGAPPAISMPPSAPLPRIVAPTLSAHAQSSGSLIGRVVAGKYAIEALIGQGTSSLVFRATHLQTQRAVALKVLHEEKLEDLQFVKRFKAEAHAASKLAHPNIAHVFDFGQENDKRLYLAMDLLTGQSLEEILTREGTLPQPRAIDLAIQACEGLAFAHDRGVIHRDVKPENLMIVVDHDANGTPCDLLKVCDFGLAKQSAPSSELADITTAGMLCGSPAYMSPEQTRGEVLDARSDVYSLGVTLFQALTGKLPHDGEGVMQVIIMKMTQPPRRPSTLAPWIDPRLEDVLMKAIANEREARHADARAFRVELREVLESLEPSSVDEMTLVRG